MSNVLSRLPTIGKLVIMALLSASVGTAAAQTTERRTRIIVSFPAGGGVDAVTRIVAESMSRLSGQPFIVENKGGAGGRIGIIDAARAPNDGYDLLATHSALAAIPATEITPEFDPEKGFVPIGLVVTIPGVIIGRPDLPANNAGELIALIRSRPSEITHAEGGVLSRLWMERFAIQGGSLKVLRVPHTGGASVTNALAGKHVDIAFTDVASAASALQSGLVKGVAITSLLPVENFPAIPTADSAGLPGFEAGTWVSLFAPSGVPEERIALLRATLRRALQEPEVIRKFKNLGMIPQKGDAGEAARLLTRDISDLTDAAIAAGLRK